MQELRQQLAVSERRLCRVLGHPRSTQRYGPQLRDDEVALTQEIIQLASQYGRYGYCRITALLRMGNKNFKRYFWAIGNVPKRPWDVNSAKQQAQ